MEHRIRPCSRGTLQHARRPLGRSRAKDEMHRATLEVDFQSKVAEDLRNSLPRLFMIARAITGSDDLAECCLYEAFTQVCDGYLTTPEFAHRAGRLATIKCALSALQAEIRQCALLAQGLPTPTPSLPSSVQKVLALKPCVAGRALDTLNAFHRAVLTLRLYEGESSHFIGLYLHLPGDVVDVGFRHALHGLLCATCIECDREAITCCGIAR